MFKSWSAVAVALVGCATPGDPEPGEPDPGEPVIDERFDVVPDRAMWDFDFGTLDPNQGQPAPSLRLFGDAAYFRLRVPLVFDHDAITASVDVASVFYETGTNSGNEYSTVGFSMETQAGVRAGVSLAVSYNVALNTPTPGFPAGKLVKLYCSTGFAMSLPLPFDHTAWHRLHFAIDGSGMTSKFDDLEICHDPLVTELDGLAMLYVGTEQRVRAGNEVVLLDNLKLYRSAP